MLAALALNVMTLGIPCIYYGTEQSFDGHGAGDGADRFIREAMFGGEFGAFASRERHFFDEDSPSTASSRRSCRLRQADRIYTRGRQFLRPDLGRRRRLRPPAMIGGQLLSVVPWSRLLDDQEAVLAINTDMDQAEHGMGDDRRVAPCGRWRSSPASTPPTPVRSASVATIEARNGLSVLLHACLRPAL